MPNSHKEGCVGIGQNSGLGNFQMQAFPKRTEQNPFAAGVAETDAQGITCNMIKRVL